MYPDPPDYPDASFTKGLLYGLTIMAAAGASLIIFALSI